MEPGEFALCPANPVLAPVPASVPGTAPFPTVLSADHLTARQNGVSTLHGNVVATQGRRRIWADVVTYERNANQLFARGHLRYASPSLSLEGPRGHYAFNPDRGTFWDTSYQLPARHGRGKAARVETYASARTGLYGLTYTTCPPHDASWHLHASRVTLNHKTEVGYAHNAWVTFKGVPLLWTPYLTFPLTDQRKSGFLAPSLSQSSSSGLDIEVPYYWNIAPNMDMTITPRLLARRGVMAMDTYRWLFPGTRGQFHFTYLPHDRVAGDSRGLAHLQDDTQLFSHWKIATSLEYVSDPNYFDDFGTSLRQVAHTFETRRVTATYEVPAGEASVSLQDNAPIDPTIRYPYRKLPEVAFNFNWPDYRTGLTPGVSNEFTRFTAPHRGGALRDDLRPSLAAHFGGASWYLTPRAAFDAARYNV